MVRTVTKENHHFKVGTQLRLTGDTNIPKNTDNREYWDNPDNVRREAVVVGEFLPKNSGYQQLKDGRVVWISDSILSQLGITL